MKHLTGWLLDLYPDQEGLVFWLLSDDGQRLRLRQPFPVTFYAAGPPSRLRALWRFLRSQPIPATLFKTERRDLFAGPRAVLGIQVGGQAALSTLFRRAADAFADLDYYDADVPPAIRHAAAYDTFPLGRCRVQADDEDVVQTIVPLESPWDLDPQPPPLRVLRLAPDCDPARAEPAQLLIRTERGEARMPFSTPRPLLVLLRSYLRSHDPDLLLTDFGDTWLIPRLVRLAHQHNIPLPLGRDPARQVATVDERTYFSYGQIVHRGRQTHLFGRLHLDRQNAMLFDDYDLEGVYEFARLTRLPVQTSARVSPGTGINAMQMLVALKSGILIPWHKSQGERPKTALELIRADQGGLVFQPIVGLHENAAEVDFVSMYPSLMVHFNISPETAGGQIGNPAALEPFESETPGIVPQTLAPLLHKRLALKARLAEMPRWDPRRKVYRKRASAQKWLLVVCFGYLGYHNYRLGRIEAHEAVTGYSREAMLRSKEAAEGLGCRLLHLYVDGMWLSHPDWRTSQDFQPVLEAIHARTGLPIALEGIYRWVVFLPSRVDGRSPVPNRYFGVFQDGSLKVRGIEARRRDTPPWIAKTQMEILGILARAPDAEHLPDFFPEAQALLQRRMAELKNGRVPLERLLLSQKLSRDLDGYRVPSPAARAAAQLVAAGKTIKPGQRVRFLYTIGEPGVRAWDLPTPPDPRTVDVSRYETLLRHAVRTVLGPLGLGCEEAVQMPLWGSTLTADPIARTGCVTRLLPVN